MNAIEQCVVSNTSDGGGNPTGGRVSGIGLAIFWQNGPLGRGDERQEPNGAFVETVISAALQRLEFYQSSKFACEENARAVGSLRGALASLKARTRAREERGVEGLHEE